MINIGIVGYGNLARGVECAIRQNPDMALAAVFTRRDPATVQILTPNVPVARLEDAIDLLPARSPLAGTPELPALPPVKTGLREAVFSAAETVLLEDALGRVAAQAACPCPPGVPVVMPGEEITKDVLRFLQGYGFFSIKVLK